MIDINRFITQVEAAIKEAKSDNNSFAFIINRAMNVIGFDQKMAGQLFGVSKPTFERWVNGTTAPHPAPRIVIYNKLLELARERQ